MLFSFTVSMAQVQVSKEPRHKNVLENKYIRLLNVWIYPGDTSLLHIHSTPSVFLIFTEANTVSQTKGGKWEKGKNVAGHSWYRSFFQDTLIHRVGNCDTVPFHVTDIELLSSFDIKTEKPIIAAVVAGDEVFYVDASTGKKKEIKPGDYLYIEPGAAFYFSFIGKEKLNMVLFEIK